MSLLTITKDCNRRYADLGMWCFWHADFWGSALSEGTNEEWVLSRAGLAKMIQARLDQNGVDDEESARAHCVEDELNAGPSRGPTRGGAPSRGTQSQMGRRKYVVTVNMHWQHTYTHARTCTTCLMICRSNLQKRLYSCAVALACRVKVTGNLPARLLSLVLG